MFISDLVLKIEELVFTSIMWMISLLCFGKFKKYIFDKIADSCLIIGTTDNPKPKYGYVVFSDTETLKKVINQSD